MEDKFFINIETLHVDDIGDSDNVSEIIEYELM